MKPRIDALLASAGRPTLSYEFFPPKSEEAATQLTAVVRELRSLGPDFVSITRTGGGAPPTIELTARFQEEFAIPAMSHLTCAGYTQEELGGLLDDAWSRGIRNVLALRGDAAPGSTSFSVTTGGFANASDLVTFAAARHDFCLGVAGYPEGHPQSLNLTRDAEYLKLKQDNGADFVITQLFYDNEDFLRWRDRVRGLGVTLPLIAGILPRSSGFSRCAGPKSRTNFCCGWRRWSMMVRRLRRPGGTMPSNSAKACWPKAWPVCTSIPSTGARRRRTLCPT